MDELAAYVSENKISIENILKYIDDYSLYSYYIGQDLELKTKYSSPLREGDDDPSFSLYYSSKNNDVIMYKDNSTGSTGDVIRFLREYMGPGDGTLISKREVLLQINHDLHLGLDGRDMGEFTPHIIKSRPVQRAAANIQIIAHKEYTDAFKKFWMTDLEISESTLRIYYTKDVRVIHYIEDFTKVVLPRTLAISYEILGTYKIYQPYEDRKFKFRNNFPESYVEGALQLTFSSRFCIITKSMKECIFFYEHFKWESVAGKSENTPISEYFMEEMLHKRYERVFIWLDSDEAGVRAQKRYIEQYPWLTPVIFDDFIGQKDPTDLFLAYKRIGQKDIALQYLHQLIMTKIS